MNRWIRHATIALSTAVLLGGPVATSVAQGPLGFFDMCQGRSHAGGDTTDERDNTPTAGFSTEFFGVTLPANFFDQARDAGHDFQTDSFFDVFFEVSIDGASGPQTGVDQFDEMGAAVADTPLFSFGPHEVTSIRVTDAGGDGIEFPTDAFGSSTFEVDDNQANCDRTVLTADEPTAEATPTAEASATPTAEATATPTTEATATDDSTGGSSSGSDAGSSWVAFLLGGIALALVGLAIWRAAGDDDDEEAGGTTTTGGNYVGGTRVRKKTPDLHTTPRGGDDDPRDVNSCDYAVYWNDPGGARILVKQARGVECCVYDVTVNTNWYTHEHVRGVRQPSKAEVEAAGGDRLRMSDIDDMGTNHLISSAEAWSRSGPAGRQDWMQGLGDIADRTPEGYPQDTYWQDKPLEERPEIVASFLDEAETNVSVVLTAGCIDHKPSYSGTTESWASMWGDGECTNDGDNPCPVELSAVGGAYTVVGGDVPCRAIVLAAGTVDELDAGLRSRLDEAGLPTEEVLRRQHLEEHVHPHAARRHFDDGDSHMKTGAVKKDTFGVGMVRGTQLHAGHIVPMPLWPATDRVTALIGGSANSKVDVAGSSDNATCNAANKCGHADSCQCSPKIGLTVCGAGGDILTVEGQQIKISFAGGPGSNSNWTVDKTNLPL